MKASGILAEHYGSLSLSIFEINLEIMWACGASTCESRNFLSKILMGETVLHSYKNLVLYIESGYESHANDFTAYIPNLHSHRTCSLRHSNILRVFTLLLDAS